MDAVNFVQYSYIRIQALVRVCGWLVGPQGALCAWVSWPMAEVRKPY